MGNQKYENFEDNISNQAEEYENNFKSKDYKVNTKTSSKKSTSNNYYTEKDNNPPQIKPNNSQSYSNNQSINVLFGEDKDLKFTIIALVFAFMIPIIGIILNIIALNKMNKKDDKKNRIMPIIGIIVSVIGTLAFALPLIMVFILSMSTP